MRALYFRESFEGNSRKFENENEDNIFENFGLPIPGGVANFVYNKTKNPFSLQDNE